MDILGWDIPIWLILVIIIIVIIYRKTTANHGIFKEQGIPGATPYPIIGTIYTSIFFTNKEPIILFDAKMYQKYGRPPVLGSFRGSKPVLVIYDKEMLKQIMVKDFENFINRDDRGITMQTKGLRKMVSLLRGEEWRNVRHHMSPTFSGSKLRKMTGLINQAGNNFVNALDIHAKSGDAFEAYRSSSAYAMDVIARVAFGLEIDTQSDPDNIFNRNSKQITDVSFKNPVLWLAILFPSCIPYLHKLGIEVAKQKPLNFFMDIVQRAMKDREENPEQDATDFLQLMIDSKLEFDQNKTDGKSYPDAPRKGLTEEEILSQSLIFFIAGMTTVSTSVSFTIYHLAVHPDVQEKAYQEIINVIGNKDLDYDDVKELKYVQMCIEESLRLFSPGFRVDRQCKSDTVINGIKIPEGIQVGIPISALHRDPEAWPEPDKFDPERFTEEAKASRHPFQYMPFGEGPRMCVAKRLAMMESKMVIAHILKNFKLVTCEKTEIPLKLQRVRVEPANGTWLKVERRE